MSGRLVILPHKSWNVWNRDNREKVARDERLHREELERKAIGNRQLLQEQQHELLLKQAKVGGEVDESTEVVEEKPFRLFEDLEKKALSAVSVKGNEEYQKEHEAKVLAQQRREGVAPLALGDGSLEYSRSLPWYLRTSNNQHSSNELTANDRLAQATTSSSSNSSNRSSSSSNSNNHPRWGERSVVDEKWREEDRKSRLDPAMLFCSSESLQHNNNKVEINCCESKEEAGIATQRVGRDEIVPSDISSDKHNKSHKDKHKHKKHKDSKANKHHNHNHAKVRREDISISTPTANQRTQQEQEQEQLMKELRIKRLERERVEKKRANILLAQMDIYGSIPTTSTSVKTYNSQYHPNLSKF